METTIALGQVDAQSWLDELGSRLAQRPGYEVMSEADDLVVSRSYVSDTRLVGSVILGLFTAGIGLLLLTRRDTESFSVSVVSDSTTDASQALVTGEWSSDTEALICQQALTGSPGPSASEVETAPEVEPAPEVLVAEVVPLGDGTQDGDATRRVAAPPDAPPVLALRLDDGRSWTLASVNIVGRGPSAPADAGDQVQLIQIDDPTQSVSKNHARVAIEGSAIRVIDLQSTNGTAVVLPDGQRLAVDAEVGVIAPDGAVIEIGERSLTVSSSTDSAGT